MSIHKHNRSAIGLHRFFALILALIMVIALMPQCFNGVLTAKAADSSGVYQVVSITSDYVYEEVDITATDLTQGEYYILRQAEDSNYYVMMSTAATIFVSTGYSGMEVQPIANANLQSGLRAYTAWTFEKTDDGTAYYISADGKYLQTTAQNGEAASLELVSDKTNATQFDIGTKTDGIYIHFTAGTDYYINLFGGYKSATAFAGYKSNDGGSTLKLFRKTGTTVNDLNGKEFAIVSGAADKAMTANSTLVNGVSGLASADVTGSTTNGTNYIIGNIPVWKFTAVTDGSDAQYYISTETAGGEIKYLRLLESGYGGGTDGRGSLTLVDESNKQPITVEAIADGKVYLKVALSGYTNTGYVNLDSSVQDFWTYNAPGSYSQLRLCEKAASGGLFYDLNLSNFMSMHKMSGGNWYESYGVAGTAPTLSSVLQSIESSSTLYTVSGSRDADGYFMYYSAEAVSGTRQALSDAGKPYGKQIRFDGWEAAAADGNTYLFAEDAQVALDTDGKIHIQAIAQKVATTDEKGNTTYTYSYYEVGEAPEITLEPGTTLTGQWTQVSDLVLFFVNYTGTILDTEGDVAGRNANQFTPVVSIGRVYYGALQVGNDRFFGGDANEAIRLKFVNNFDYSDPDPQIIIDFVTVYDTDTDSYTPFTPVNGINDTELEKYLLNYIKDSRTRIQVTSADKNGKVTYIDPDNATPENYSVRWYVMKEQNDGWHIDGVMVAKTAEITVVKNFSGLNQARVNTVLGSYNMPVQLGTGKQEYFTITPKTIDGQVKYEGKYIDNAESYRWTLHAITDEQYTLSEADYKLDGYDVSTMVLQYYTDANGVQQTEYVRTTSTDSFTHKVIGGSTTTVAFNNFYTPSGTGAVSILKRAENANGTGAVLPGAVFTLYDSLNATANVIATGTSNESGATFFSGLNVGTYYLKETAAPAGYEQFDGYWKVNVTRVAVENADAAPDKSVNQDDGGYYYILVTIQAFDKDGNAIDKDPVTCYDGGIITTYVIENDPKDTTVTIVKTFSGLTAAEMNTLRTNSAAGREAPYYIELTDGTNTWQRYLTGTDVVVDQTGFVYTWTLTDMMFADTTYTLKEYNYLSDTYADTIVTANKTCVETSQSDGTKTTSSSDLNVALSYTNGGTATISNITFAEDGSGVNYSNRTINVSNKYTNTFDLKLRKVDSKTGDPLTGASFKVYGPFNQSTNTTDFITYQGTKYYYIGTTAPSGADGYTTWSGLTLSREGSTTFVYFLSEWQAPAGYVKLDDPIYASVTVNVTGSEYSGGVLSMEAPNTQKQYAKTDVTVSKQWGSGERPAVTMELYRMVDGEATAALISTVTLDGNEETPWSYTWKGLDAYYTVTNADNTTTSKEYTYYIREVPISGFSTTYSGTPQMLTVGGETFEAAPAKGTATAKSVIVTNTVLWDIPTVGGPGIYWMMLGGVFLMCLAAGGLLLLGRTSGGRREAQRVRPVHAPRRGKREEGVDR